MGWLGVLYTLLNSLDFVLNVTVRNKNIGPSIEVIIKEEARETKGEQALSTDIRTRSFVDEQRVAFVVVERHHLIGKVPDDNARPAGAIVVDGIYSHSCPSHAILAERDSRNHRTLFKTTVLRIDVEFIGLSIVGDDEVRPSIAIHVRDRYSKRLRSWIVQPGL